MRVLGGIALATLVAGCTSVKMVQRDGCWIRRTEKVFGRVQEEMGPCSRPQPKWADDRLTRLVQECVAQADYRWHAQSLGAWSRKAPYPAQPTQQDLLRACLDEARSGLASENDARTAKERLAEVASERDALRVAEVRDRDELRASNDRIAEWLGKAATKPDAPATATATATSDGRATNDSGSTLNATAHGAPGAPGVSTATVQGVPGAPGAPGSSTAIAQGVPAAGGASGAAAAPRSAASARGARDGAPETVAARLPASKTPPRARTSRPPRPATAEACPVAPACPAPASSGGAE